ncbi:SDR family oxidoreductase, partial [Streptomyces sp. NPDC091376]|uniref:SDR family oxidoreductase n=1 Tax=Streptomyces sp. NPDC091376 TaxID=3365994 RepID=UPI0038243D01
APVAPLRESLVQDSHVVRVSAADETALRALAGAYAERFETARDDWETADLCHTANTGRSPLEFQTAVYGHTAAELAAALRSVAAGGVPVARVDIDLTAEEAAGRSGATRSTPTPAPADVVDWVRAGYAHIDWASLSAKGARVTDLPTYPFARGSYWHTTDRAVVPGSAAAGGQAVRVEWRARELAPALVAAPATVRLVAADPEIGRALTTALRDRSVTVVEPGREADATIVVDAPDSRRSQGGPTGELSGFWEDLGNTIKTLPAYGKLLWAGFHDVAVQPGERGDLSPERAAMAMAVRAAGAENRKPTAVVHLDPADPAEAHAVRLAAEYAALSAGPAAGADAGTVAAAYRRGVRYTPEPVPTPAGPPYALPASGYYLVTGGLGAVGLRLTERLVDRGAKRIGIIGRSVVDAESSAPLRELARRAEVEYLACDVSDPAALAAVAGQFGRRWGRLVGIVHSSGGVNPFGAMHRRTWDDAEKVLAPKVAGSLNVVRLAKEQGADFTVLVSSIAGTQALAGRGLVDYSLANAYQLALAERENDAVTTVTAHAWPNWTGIGMKADASFSAAYSLSAEQALDAFFDHLRSGGAVIFPGSAPATPPEAAESVPAARAESAESVPAARAEAGASTVARVAPHVPAARTGQDVTGMRARVRDAFVQVLGEDPGDRPLQRLGLDSLVIAELTTALEQRSDLTVDPSLLMRARTADEIAADLAAHAAPVSHRPPTPDHEDVPTSALSALLRPLLEHDGQRGPGQA